MVCQEAGVLQGCLPCDLGDIGKGSLDDKAVQLFLDILITAVVSIETSVCSDRHVQQQQQDKFRIDLPHKLLLEVTVRFLNIAQRNFLVRHECKEIEDPTQTIIDHIKQQPYLDDYYSLPTQKHETWPTCSGVVLSESPFVKYIVGPIYKATRPQLLIMTNETTLLQQALSTVTDNTVTTTTGTMSERKFVGVLHLLCASAELFPLGSCWTTSTQNNWRRFSCNDEKSSLSMSTTPPPYDFITMNGCSALDLATIVDVLGNVLVQYGGQAASTSIQKWSLLSLMRLITCTDELYNHDAEIMNGDNNFTTVGIAWQRIWNIVHDNDYCYNKSTTETSNGEVGNLVVQLLTQIIRYSCTDPSKAGSSRAMEFLINRQSDVWNMKAYEQCQMKNPSPFILLYTAIVRIGVSDAGSSCGVGALADHDELWQSLISRYGNGQRSKLLCYCLHCLLVSMDKQSTDEIFPAIFSCISALINGFSAPPWSLLAVTGGLNMQSLVNRDDNTHVIPICNDNTKFLDSKKNQFDLLENLWSTRSLDTNISIAAICTSDTYYPSEVVEAARQHVSLQLLHRELQLYVNNMVAVPSDRNRFIALLQEDFVRIVSGSSSICSVWEISDDNVEFRINQLKRRILIAKASISIFMTNATSISEKELEFSLAEAASVFNEASSFLSNAATGNKDLSATLTNLTLLVRGLMAVQQENGLEWPTFFNGAASKLYDSCSDLLEICIIIDTFDDVQPTKNGGNSKYGETPTSSNRHHNFDSNQREWKGYSGSGTQQTHGLHRSFFCSRSIAFLIGSLLIELHPVYKNYEFVSKKLLGVATLGILQENDHTIDVLGGLLSIIALTAKPYRIVSQTGECEYDTADSGVMLLLKVVRAIRCSSDPSSLTHLFGYQSCASAVTTYDRCHWMESLYSAEAKELLDIILSPEWRKSLTQRPHFRFKQLLAGISVFDNADTKLHSEIDPLFGLTFVVPPLSDLKQCIRRHSCLAVVTAMVQLSEDKVVENVRKRLCPLTGDKEIEYTRWYANKIVLGGVDESICTVEGRIWADAHSSICFDTLLCWCAIAAATSTREILQQVLFDLITACVEKPLMEDICFLAIERIAYTCGFPNIETFLNSEMRDISLRWVEKGWSFHQLPLMVCIPSTYKCLMRSRFLGGVKAQVTGSSTETELEWGQSNVSEIAVFEFLRRQSKYFFPQIIILSVEGVTHSAITKEGRRKLLDDDLFKEYCSALFASSYNDDIAIKTVRKLMPIVMAEAAHRDANVAKNLILLLKGLLSEKVFQSKCQECACLSFRRAVEIMGEMTSCEENGVENLWVLSNLLELKHDMSGVAMLRSARCTIAELLSFVRLTLDTSHTHRQLLSRWRSAEGILRLVLDDGKAIHGSEVLFCVDFLFGVIKAQSQSSIRVFAIKSVKDILLVFAKDTNLSEQNSFLFKTAFRVVMSFHRRCQTELIKRCMDLWEHKAKYRLFGVALLCAPEGDSNANSFWNWLPETGLSTLVVPFSEIWMNCNQYVPMALIEQIVSSYEVLAFVIQESLSLKILQVVLGSFCIDPLEVATCNQLSCINPTFAAQLMALEFATCKVSLDKLDITKWKCTSDDKQFLDAEHIQMELSALAHILRSTREEVTGNEKNQNCYYDKDLIVLLVSFCAKSLPAKTRIAASRCLAEINATAQTNTIISATKVDHLSLAIEQDCLVTFTQSCILEAVEASVKSTNSKISLIAIDTLKVLMSTVIGQRCAELLTETKSRGNLFLLVSGTKSMGSGLVLNENEVAELRNATTKTYAKNCKDWCWDDCFWIHDSSAFTFELWISRLVAAMLVCCYDSSGGNTVIGPENNFYSACQRISIMNPNVACKIFPSIILDLLLRDGFDGDKTELDAVLADTWIGRCNGKTNNQLSRCLCVFLQCLPQRMHSQSVQLVIDLLDMLRRYTQHKFKTSTHHKTNRRRNKEAQQGAVNTNTSYDEKRILWHRPPYGIVLKLDGLIVANACIYSRRFESAIFYAELFANARFGGPRHALTANNLSIQQSSRVISGFCTDENRNEAIDDDVVSYFGILQQCYSALGDEDARNAAEQLESDFNFSHKKGSLLSASSTLREAPSIQKLLFLDKMAMHETNSSGMRIPILNCLDGLGFHGLLETYIRGLAATTYAENHGALEENDFLREKLFECNLFTKQWDDPIFRSANISVGSGSTHRNKISSNMFEGYSTGGGFNEQLSVALDALKRGDLVASRKSLSRARLRFVDDLIDHETKTSMFTNISVYIDRLRTMNDLEDYVNMPRSTECLQRILLPVDSVEGNPSSRSSYSDCIRGTVLNYVSSTDSVWNSISHDIAKGLEMQFQLHLLGHRHQAAQESLYRLDSVLRSQNNPILNLQLRLHEAQLLEGRNDFTSAIRNTKMIIKNMQESSCDDIDKGLLVDSLLLCGQWIAKYKVEPASSILENYLQPAAAYAFHLYGNDNSLSNAERATRALLAQGQLVSNLFEAVSSRVNALEWQKAEISLTEREVECENLRLEEARNKAKNQTDQLYRQYLEREIKSTRTQRNHIVGSLETYRVQAVKSIATALVISGETGPEDLLNHIYRLVAILFTSEHGWSKSLDEVVNETVKAIPSFRFVPLVNQLLSRIANTKIPQRSTFQNRLQELIIKLSFDHPYHCIIHLLTLSETKMCGNAETNDKAECANLILNKLIRKDPEFRAQLIESHKKLSFAYIHVAIADTSELKQMTSTNISFDKICKISNCRLDRCLGSGARKAYYVPCILTKPPTICPNADYGNGRENPIGSELVDTFESTFTITESGVNQPKIVICIGSGKGRFRQLVKGADDTRQDAVMEQVFSYANKILKLQRGSNVNGISKYHDLRLVTYNIVPLSYNAGVSIVLTSVHSLTFVSCAYILLLHSQVLEWVEHSSPFGDFIVDKMVKSKLKGSTTRTVGAHSRYFPTEWSSDRCRLVLTALWKEYQKPDGLREEGYDGPHHKEKLREAFDMIYENHSPVFRYFFVENFLNPEIWYASKMRYTRSVAVSSIVGHILGIGACHVL